MPDTDNTRVRAFEEEFVGFETQGIDLRSMDITPPLQVSVRSNMKGSSGGPDVHVERQNIPTGNNQASGG